MIALIPILAATLMTATTDATSLVGLWESSTTSSGGIGHALEFREDGTFVEASTVMVDLHYRVTGDRLFVGEEPPQTDADEGEAVQIEIEGDTLIQTAPDRSVVRKERLGRVDEREPAIVGVWRYRHYTEAIAFERYTDDGRLLFRLPMSSSVGRYLLKPHELLLTRPNRPDARVTMEIHGDNLSLSREDGQKTDYRRVTAGPWYGQGTD